MGRDGRLALNDCNGSGSHANVMGTTNYLVKRTESFLWKAKTRIIVKVQELQMDNCRKMMLLA
jgi:hypothetical protein